MRDVLVGTSASFRIDFDSELGLMLADSNSASYTLYSPTGTVLDGPTSVSTTDTGVIIAINSSKHTIASPLRFEHRTLIVSWTNTGRGYQKRFAYRVVPFLSYTVTENDVRSQLGTSQDELSDSDIDLFSAYLTVEQELDAGVLSAALVAGTYVAISANTAIACQAAIQIIPSLQLRSAQSVTDGDQKFDRFRATPDWDALLGSLMGKKAFALADITGDDGTGAAQTLAIFAQPADAITG